MNTTLIVPGWRGSPEPHWQHWWLSEGANARMVVQDDWHYPDPQAWENRLAARLEEHPGARIVAHSLGAILAIRVAVLRRDLAIGGALLVALADIEQGGLPPYLAQFAPIPRVPLRFPTIVAASRNDPWITQAKAASLARSWGAQFVDLGWAGHVNPDSGFGAWPLGHSLLASLEKRAEPVTYMQLRGASFAGAAP